MRGIIRLHLVTAILAWAGARAASSTASGPAYETVTPAAFEKSGASSEDLQQQLQDLLGGDGSGAAIGESASSGKDPDTAERAHAVEMIRRIMQKEREAEHDRAEAAAHERHIEEVDANAASEDEDERLANLAVVLGLAGLALTIMLARLLEHAGIWWLPEAGAGILVGMTAGGLVLAVHSKAIEDLKFEYSFFMSWLLPPIIFEAGYNMRREFFFGNIGATLQYAFVGTFVSTFVVGGIVYAAGQLGWAHPLGVLASLLFGALISATDPVTVLAVFQRLGVDYHLFAIVFGESVMNDAVAIVLVRTLLGFQEHSPSLATVFQAFGTFAGIFVGSLGVGVLLGLGSALVFKVLHLRSAEELSAEVLLVVCFAWASFYLAEFLDLSGIVAILFCGVVMAHYTYENMSAQGQEHTVDLFKSVASFAETFIFVYLGFAFFAFPIYSHTVWRLVFVALFACLVGRLVNIAPNTAVINLWRKARPEGAVTPADVDNPAPISFKAASTLWFSGLRGGVAFALASVIYERNYFAEADGLAILQTTLLIAILTIFLMGGPIEAIAVRLDLLEKAPAVTPRSRQPSGSGTELPPKRAPPKRSPTMAEVLDTNYLKPVFTFGSARQLPEHGEEGGNAEAGIELAPNGTAIGNGEAGVARGAGPGSANGWSTPNEYSSGAPSVGHGPIGRSFTRRLRLAPRPSKESPNARAGRCVIS